MIYMLHNASYLARMLLQYELQFPLKEFFLAYIELTMWGIQDRFYLMRIILITWCYVPPPKQTRKIPKTKTYQPKTFPLFSAYADFKKPKHWQRFILISEVYADPSYRSYEALRFVSGITTTFTPGVCKLDQCSLSLTFMYSNSGLAHLFLFTSNIGRSENNTSIHGWL